MIKQECIGIPDMILLLMNFLFQKKMKNKAEITMSRKLLSPGGAYFYTCDKQVLWESAVAFFSARQLSDFTRQLARFTRSWSSAKMLAFQPRGFVFEPVGMR